MNSIRSEMKNRNRVIGAFILFIATKLLLKRLQVLPQSEALFEFEIVVGNCTEMCTNPFDI